MNSIAKNDVVQIVPEHKWGGCFAVVDEVRSWGVQAYVTMPSNEPGRTAPAYIRLISNEYEQLNVQAIFTLAGDVS